MKEKENRSIVVNIKNKKAKRAIVSLFGLSNDFRTFIIKFQNKYHYIREINKSLENLISIQKEKLSSSNEELLKELEKKEKYILKDLDNNIVAKQQELNLFIQFLEQQKQIKIEKLRKRDRLTDKKVESLNIGYSIKPRYMKFDFLYSILDVFYQDDENYQKIKEKLPSQTRQQILKKVLSEEYEGYISSLENYFDNLKNQSKNIQKPRRPKYHIDDYYPYILTNQQVKLKNGKFSFPQLFLDHFGKDNLICFDFGKNYLAKFLNEEWVIKQVEINYRRSKNQARLIVIYDKDVDIVTHKFINNPTNTWSIDLGVNNLATIANIPQFMANIEIMNKNSNVNLTDSFYQYSSKNLVAEVKKTFNELDQLKSCNIKQVKHRILHENLPYKLEHEHVKLKDLTYYERDKIYKKLVVFIKQKYSNINEKQINKKANKLLYVLFNHHEHKGLNNKIVDLAQQLEINILKKKKVYLSAKHNYNAQELNKKAVKQQKITKKMRKLELKLHHLFSNFLHTLSCHIVEEAYKQNIKHIIIGYNPGWKNRDQKFNKWFKRLFKRIPFTQFIHLITYKAKEKGILVETISEDYTSKIDHFANEPMFHQNSFLGKRQGKVFKSSLKVEDKPLTYDADVNGAIGIFRKALESNNLNLLTILNLAQDEKQRACQLNVLMARLIKIKALNLNRVITSPSLASNPCTSCKNIFQEEMICDELGALTINLLKNFYSEVNSQPIKT